MPSSSNAIIGSTYTSGSGTIAQLGIISGQTAVQDGTVTAPPNSTTSVSNQKSNTAPYKTIATVQAKANNTLLKIQLMATLSDNSVIKYTVQYNPETLEITKGTRFGQYGGVQYQPRMYYSGVEVNKMEIRTIVIDRTNGLLPILQNLYQFSNPDPTVKSSFATPPLSLLSYGATGVFTGYVERPRLEIQEWNNSLKPIRGYLSFSFNVIQHSINNTGL